MEIVSDRTDNILTISPAGRLDAFGASQLDEAVKQFVADDDFFVVIDMGNVPYLSSGGIRILFATEKMLKRRDGGIHLCNVNAYPLQVLEMAGFDQLFMGTLRYDISLIDDDDLVGSQNSADTLGDNQAGALAHHSIQGVLDFCLRFHIDRAGGVVED